MTYTPTILNISAAVFLIGLVIYTALNYAVLSAEEGWGVVAMFGLAGVGLLAGVVDLVLQIFIRDRRTLNIVGLLIAVAIGVAVIWG